MIEFDQVTKRFGEITALEGVSFKVLDGEFVFLIGPSGAGKTTVVKLLLREYTPTSGKIIIDDQNLTELKSKEVSLFRQKIGVVFQDFKLLADRTVFENAALPLEVLGQSKEDIVKAVTKVLRLVGLTKRAHLFPAQLAGGEIQRVCIARAVVGQPKIVIADEPTGNLDPATSWQIIKLLKKINQQGTTVLVATHNFEVVNSFKQRVIEFDQAKLVSDSKRGKYKTK